MEVKFRKATFEDIPMLVDLCNKCFDENTDIDRARQLFLKTQDEDTQIYLVGEFNGEIVAHVCYKKSGYIAADAQCFYKKI